MSATTEAPVTWAGWICTGRYMGTCKGCGTFLRIADTPAQRHDISHECACGRWNDLRQVMGSMVEDKRCDRRCTNAKGFDCECSCGGHNHGADR